MSEYTLWTGQFVEGSPATMELIKKAWESMATQTPLGECMPYLVHLDDGRNYVEFREPDGTARGIMDIDTYINLCQEHDNG